MNEPSEATVCSDSDDVFTLMEKNKQDPVCGNCGNHRSEHFYEGDGVFCNEVTNGDIFTDEPRNEILADWMEDMHPTMYQSILRNWRLVNGHDQ